MSKGKSEFYKTLLSHSEAVNKVNPKIALLIKIYTFENYNLPKEEKEKLRSDIEIKYNQLKLKKEKNISNLCNYDELTEFINKLFIMADEEDKSDSVSLTTAAIFRLMVDLVELLTIWRPLEEEWIQFRKYCKYRTICIFNKFRDDDLTKKCDNENEKILEGISEPLESEIPEEEIETELNQMIKDGEIEKQLKPIEKPIDNPIDKPTKLEIPIEKQNSTKNSINSYQSVDIFLNSLNLKNSIDNNNSSNINLNKNSLNNVNIQNTDDRIKPRSHTMSNFSSKQNITNSLINQSSTQQVTPTYPPQQNLHNNEIRGYNGFVNNFTKKMTNSSGIVNNAPKFSGIKPKKEDKEYNELMKAISDLKKDKIPSNLSSKIPKIVTTNEPSNNFSKKEEAEIKTINKKEEPPNVFKRISTPMLENFKSSLNVKLPVKMRSPEYFNLMNLVKKSLNNATRELESNKTSKCLSDMENVLFLFTKIE